MHSLPVDLFDGGLLPAFLEFLVVGFEAVVHFVGIS